MCKDSKKIVLIFLLCFLYSLTFSQQIVKQTKKKTQKDNLEKRKTAASNLSSASPSDLGIEKASKINNFHFENEHLSAEVLNRLNFNKAHQKPLSDGILKSYKVAVKTCTNEEITNKTFSFLKNTNGFIKADFISSSMVNIIVTTETNSIEIKDKLLSQGLQFNFISETYFLK